MCLYVTDNIEVPLHITYKGPYKLYGALRAARRARCAVAVAKARSWARCGLLGFDGPAALAMFLECIRDVGEWVREG